MMKKGINVIKQYEKKIWSGVGASVSAGMDGILKKDPLIVVDVGAAGGHEPRWQSLQGCAKFVEFEPDLRATDMVDSDTIRIPKALGASKGTQKLHLTRFPAASSLFPINTEVLSNYANFACHEVVGEMSVELDTLDSCMKSYQIEPHFLKIDAEGAELDILKGGAATLATSVLGLRAEVNFQERQLGAPLFNEIDQYLRKEGFELHGLNREHWIRKNGHFSVNSQPQVVWADVVYFLSRDRFVESMKSLSNDKRISRLAHFVVILQCHGAHDFAFDIVQSCMGLMPESILQDLTASIKRSQASMMSFVLRSAAGCLLWGTAYVLSLPVTKWRTKIGSGFRSRAALVLQTAARWMSRGGPQNACVADHSQL